MIVKKSVMRKSWETKFYEKILLYHKRNGKLLAKRLMKKADVLKHGLVHRSKKKNVECNITAEQLRILLYESYGTPCKYCSKVLTIHNFVVDHIVPISRGGSSNTSNLQIICKTCNSIKGSLDEDNLQVLLTWLDSVSDELRKDIRIRLAHGIH